MALPALGAAAKFLMANGARAATMKFGKAAVDKAKNEIKKRESAVMKKTDEANIGVKKESSPQSIRRGQDTKRNKRVAKEERTSGRSDALRPPKDEMPLKFRGGGMKSKMGTKGGAMGGKKKMPPGMMAGGLKKVPEGNKGLPKLPKKVRNQMGYMQAGGMKRGYAEGGKKVTKGYAAGGKKSKMATKKKVSKAKVRGAGIARKGVRPVKYR